MGPLRVAPDLQESRRREIEMINPGYCEVLNRYFIDSQEVAHFCELQPSGSATCANCQRYETPSKPETQTNKKENENGRSITYGKTINGGPGTSTSGHRGNEKGWTSLCQSGERKKTLSSLGDYGLGEEKSNFCQSRGVAKKGLG